MMSIENELLLDDLALLLVTLPLWLPTAIIVGVYHLIKWILLKAYHNLTRSTR